jgi:hypothetical protein
MSWQLIYTSAPRGLLSGQSGFCTVARSAELREALVNRLEQISSYHYLRVAEVMTANRNPTISAFRLLDLRGAKYYVLTRIQPCGLDFTARTNHLAHHVIFQPDELAALPSPAAILRHWPGWLASWQGESRILEDPSLDGFDAAAKPCLPAQTWMQLTGDAGRAAGLLESECIRGCYLVCPPGSEQQVLEMFCETMQLLNLNGQYPLRPWRHPFTTFLQAEDNPGDFQWRACQEGTPAYQQAVQRTATVIPLRSVRVPNNSLVKAARERQKAPLPPPTAPAQSKLTLQAQTATKGPAGMELSDTGHWRKPVPRREKPTFLGISFSIRLASLARIGIFVAVLLGLWVMKHSLSKRHAPQERAPETKLAPAKSAPPARIEKADNPAGVQKPVSQTRPLQTAPPDLTQLNCLSGDGPTYMFVMPYLMKFDLPIDSISRFQNLIQRFDKLDILPNGIRLSLSTNEWGFRHGWPMSVNGMQRHTLSAQTVSDLKCSFDYSDWLSKNTNAVVVQTTFAAPPQSFSVQFDFPPQHSGDPFRLLIVNENNPPVPLHFGMQWLRINSDSLAGSLRPPLSERLFSNFLLPDGRRLQLQPFIGTKGKTHPLYKDWPAEDLPSLGDELDFAVARKRLSAQLTPLNERAKALGNNWKQQTEQAGLDKPLGEYLRLTNENLTSFSIWIKETRTNAAPTPALFVRYLNDLKTKGARERPWMITWPVFAEEDTQLPAQFQQVYDSCINKFPAEQFHFMAGNYFSAVWQNLKEIEKTRQEQQRARNEVDKLRKRLNDVPDTLEKVAYVGLFIIDPPKPDVEMIRFEGP